MRKRIVLGIVVAVVVVAGVLQVPAVKSELAWRAAERADSLETYREFVAAYPESRHLADAQARLDELSWQRAELEGTKEAVLEYLRLYPVGTHAAEAQARLDTLLWERVTADGSVDALLEYLEWCPDGAHSVDAEARLDEADWERALGQDTEESYEWYAQAHPDGAHVSEVPRLCDEACWTVAAAGTIKDLERYLTRYPAGAHVAEAKAISADMSGRDIFELLATGKVEARIAGSDIQNVRVEVRRKTEHTLTVRIPVGAYFTAGSSGVQNMITIEQIELELETDDWESAEPRVACTNISRDIPGETDTFGVTGTPDNTELRALMKAIAGLPDPVDYPVAQAAVWIVTDDADWGDLGILVSSAFGFGGTRVIEEDDAAAAMRLCEQAGIQIARKAIWRDRQAILDGMNDGPLREWLAAHG